MLFKYQYYKKVRDVLNFQAFYRKKKHFIYINKYKTSTISKNSSKNITQIILKGVNLKHRMNLYKI